MKQETLELFKEYEKNKSEDIRNKIVLLNQGLVRAQVKTWQKKTNVPYDDLVQIGMLGLINAVEKFDLLKGFAFSSFAIPYIRGEIQHYIRDKEGLMRIPRTWQDKKKQIKALGNIKDEDAAKALNVSLYELHRIKSSKSNPLSLDFLVSSEDTEFSYFIGTKDKKNDDLYYAIESLPSREKQVVKMIFLKNGTQKELARELKCSLITISRLKRKALKNLKEIMSA